MENGKMKGESGKLKNESGKRKNETITKEFLNQCSYSEFFRIIFELGGISEIYIKVLDMISKTAFENDALKVLCIYFSLVDDGNTCIALDSKILLKKWRQKWSGLVIDSLERNGSRAIEDEDDTFKSIIERGTGVLNGFAENAYSKLIFDFGGEENANEAFESVSAPFVTRTIGGARWLFFAKFFDAKTAIERRMKVLMRPSKKYSEQNANFESEIEGAMSYFKSRTGILLNEEQAEAVVRGKSENLMITGGPGSGKTTAVCFLLWNLLKSKDEEGFPFIDYGIYLAAPSGKAAYRMKESISSSLSSFADSANAGSLSKEDESIVKKLLSSNPYTIHRLLGFNPGRNSFSYNESNQFDRKSVFIIDEASMLDINMFASLLRAIPDGARIFILGDRDQLPSVDAGAVLQEIIAAFPENVITLKKSNRFSSDSEVGRLRNAIVDETDSFPAKMEGLGTWINADGLCKEFFEEESADSSANCKKKYPVFFSDIEDREIELVVRKWTERFYENIAGRFIHSGFECKKDDVGELRKIYKESLEAKILCAQRSGPRGCESINAIVENAVAEKFGGNGMNGQFDFDGKYFSGQILMLTKNQRLFDLFNGDSGIVVTFKGERTKYLMVEKKDGSDLHSDEKNFERKRGEGIFRIGEFMFYPLHLLPSDSIEPSYAMTIHKSQGSGYANIMIFLPKKKGHPLLNNQIFYTAVTRTEGKTFVISTEEAMNDAKRNRIIRESKISRI